MDGIERERLGNLVCRGEGALPNTLERITVHKSLVSAALSDRADARPKKRADRVYASYGAALQDLRAQGEIVYCEPYECIQHGSDGNAKG